jgi:hypothetical protein
MRAWPRSMTFEGEGKGLAGTVDPFILMTCQKTGQADA